MSNQIGKISIEDIRGKRFSLEVGSAPGVAAVRDNWTTSFTSSPVMVWNPHPDITTHELALAMNVLLSRDNWFAFYKSLSENVQRHFEVRRL